MAAGETYLWNTCCDQHKKKPKAVGKTVPSWSKPCWNPSLKKVAACDEGTSESDTALFTWPSSPCKPGRQHNLVGMSLPPYWLLSRRVPLLQSVFTEHTWRAAASFSDDPVDLREEARSPRLPALIAPQLPTAPNLRLLMNTEASWYIHNLINANPILENYTEALHL